MLQDCDVEQILQAGLIETVQIGVLGDAVRVVASDVEVALRMLIFVSMQVLSVHDTSIAEFWIDPAT